MTAPRVFAGILLATLGLASAGLGCDPSEEPPVEEPSAACATGELTLTGELNSVTVNERHAITSHVLANVNGAAGDGNLRLAGPDGELVATFAIHLGPDSSVPAAITATFMAPARTHVGNCSSISLPSTVSMDSDGQGGTYVIRELLSDPACNGGAETAATGELRGCFRFE